MVPKAIHLVVMVKGSHRSRFPNYPRIGNKITGQDYCGKPFTIKLVIGVFKCKNLV